MDPTSHKIRAPAASHRVLSANRLGRVEDTLTTTSTEKQSKINKIMSHANENVEGVHVDGTREATNIKMVVSPRDDKEGFHSPMEHNADSSNVGGVGAEDKNDSEATGPSASSAKDEASYLQTLMPGWRRVDCIDRKSVTFASDVKEGGVLTVDDDGGDLAMGAEDERKQGTTAVVEENAGRNIGDFAMTDGGLISSWDVDEGESPYRLAFYEVTEVGDFAVEDENESSMAMDEENERKEGTTAVAEEDAWRNRDDLAMTGAGTLEGSADCDEPGPVLVLPTTLSSPPVEGDEPRSKKRWALILLVLVLLIATILILVFR